MQTVGRVKDTGNESPYSKSVGAAMILHEYQERAVRFLIEKKRAGLFADLGLGKTLITLEALHQIFFDRLEVVSALVIAPLKVVYNVWPDEIAKWNYPFRYHIYHKKNRFIDPKAHLTLINYEGLSHLYKHNRDYKPDIVIFDESTFIKNQRTLRWRYANVMFADTPYIWLLTGTPAPNSIEDLWAQIYLLDRGKRLGYNITSFRNAYMMVQNPWASFKKWVPKKGSVSLVTKKIADITMKLDKAELAQSGKVPAVSYVEYPVILPPDKYVVYRELEREFHTLITGKPLTVTTAATLGVKLRQLASGIAYSDTGEPVILHQEKLDMLKTIVDSRPDTNFMIVVNFRCEAEVIQKHIRPKKSRIIYGNMDDKYVSETIELWNSGELPILIVHPASIGHGVNLQSGGDTLIWFGPTWSLEHWIQTNGRLARQGQKRPVTVITLVAVDTKDETVVSALKNKKALLKEIVKNDTK